MTMTHRGVCMPCACVRVLMKYHIIKRETEPIEFFLSPPRLF